jgi:hypothetical protein
MKKYTDLELNKIVKSKGYTILETCEDYELKNECYKRGLQICDATDCNLYTDDGRIGELEDLIHEAYKIAIDINYIPDKLYKFVENNFKNP